MRDFKKLLIWEKGHKLVIKVYDISKILPKDELYGITSQIRRAVVSVPTNIAEGAGKKSTKDFSRYLNIALGSLSEVQYLLFLIKELNFIIPSQIEDLENEANDLKKMLYKYIVKINEN
jgi:four helix bundle protein